MTNETKIIFGIIALSIVLLIGGIFYASSSAPKTTQDQSGKEIYSIDYQTGQKVGSDSAKVKLVEFSDLQCPACAAAQPIVKRLVTEKGDQIQFVHKHFPLPQHKHARAAANAAEEVAAQNPAKFYEYADALFTRQSEWEGLGDAKDFFAKVAAEMGLDGEKVKAAIDNNTYNDRIQANVNEGNSLGVNSTPTFFINGEKINLRTYSDLEARVNEALQ